MSPGSAPTSVSTSQCTSSTCRIRWVTVVVVGERSGCLWHPVQATRAMAAQTGLSKSDRKMSARVWPSRSSQAPSFGAPSL